LGISPELSLNSQNFQRWIKLWGDCQPNGQDLMAPDHAAGGAAVAVYSPATGPRLRFNLVKEFVERIVNPRDLVADYLDEYRHIVDALTERDMKTESMVKQAISEIEGLEPEAIQKRLLEVRSDRHRLGALEDILRTMLR
jgi:hypothetical protein